MMFQLFTFEVQSAPLSNIRLASKTLPATNTPDHFETLKIFTVKTLKVLK